MEIGGRNISNWIIARCAPGATLNLELEIRGKGFGVWAPRYRVMRRIHKKRSTEPVDVALLPGFVFVAAKDKYGIDHAKFRPPGFRNRFSWFIFDGIPPIVHSDDLLPLREVELRMALEHFPQKPRIFAIGTEITIKAGPFEGLCGKVAEWHGGHYTVEIAGFPGPFRVSPFLIEANRASSP